MDEAEAIIRHWLHQEPAEDLEDFARQAKQALWLEERHQRFIAQVMGAKTR